MSNYHELSHLMSAFRTSDRGFRKENGSPVIVWPTHNCQEPPLLSSVHFELEV